MVGSLLRLPLISCRAWSRRTEQTMNLTRCPLCGSDSLVEHHGEYCMESAGDTPGSPMLIPNSTWHQCRNCGEELLPRPLTRALEAEQRRRVSQLFQVSSDTQFVEQQAAQPKAAAGCRSPEDLNSHCARRCWRGGAVGREKIFFGEPVVVRAMRGDFNRVTLKTSFFRLRSSSSGERPTSVFKR